jgi:hypothetical protein
MKQSFSLSNLVVIACFRLRRKESDAGCGDPPTEAGATAVPQSIESGRRRAPAAAARAFDWNSALSTGMFNAMADSKPPPSCVLRDIAEAGKCDRSFESELAGIHIVRKSAPTAELLPSMPITQRRDDMARRNLEHDLIL